MLGGGAAKGLKNRAAIGILFPIIFRVPLHAQRETARPFHPHRFDGAIGCPGLSDQARRQALHCLVMQ